MCVCLCVYQGCWRGCGRLCRGRDEGGRGRDGGEHDETKTAQHLPKMEVGLIYTHTYRQYVCVHAHTSVKVSCSESESVRTYLDCCSWRWKKTAHDDSSTKEFSDLTVISSGVYYA